MKEEVFNDDENMENVRVEVTRYELFNQTFRYFNIFLRDCLLPAPTHIIISLRNQSIPREKKLKVFQLKIAQFIHHSQDRTLSTEYLWNIYCKSSSPSTQPSHTLRPTHAEAIEWKLKSVSFSPSTQLFHPPPVSQT